MSSRSRWSPATYGAAARADISKVIKERIKDKDVKLVIDEYFPAGTADFSSQIAKGKQLQPDLWIGLLYPSEAIETVRQFHSMNYMPKLFIANGVSQDDFITSAGKDAEYALGMSRLRGPSLPSEGNKEFVKTYRAKYNADPGYYSAFGFVGGTVLEAAVKQAGSIETEKVREALTTLKIGSVMGRHEVDPENLHADRRAGPGRAGAERQARGGVAGRIQDRRAEAADPGLGQTLRSIDVGRSRTSGAEGRHLGLRRRRRDPPHQHDIPQGRDHDHCRLQRRRQIDRDQGRIRALARLERQHFR